MRLISTFLAFGLSFAAFSTYALPTGNRASNVREPTVCNSQLLQVHEHNVESGSECIRMGGIGFRPLGTNICLDVKRAKNTAGHGSCWIPAPGITRHVDARFARRTLVSSHPISPDFPYPHLRHSSPRREIYTLALLPRVLGESHQPEVPPPGKRPSTFPMGPRPMTRHPLDNHPPRPPISDHQSPGGSQVVAPQAHEPDLPSPPQPPAQAIAPQSPGTASNPNPPNGHRIAQFQYSTNREGNKKVYEYPTYMPAGKRPPVNPGEKPPSYVESSGSTPPPSDASSRKLV